MIAIKELINKIKWDKRLNPDDYFLYYYDRIENILKEKGINSFGKDERTERNKL